MSELTGLPEILDASRVEAGQLVAGVPDTWMQGRTGYGGLTAALAHEAARRVIGDLPPLRSAQVNFIAPVTGEIRVAASLLRQGKSTAFVETEARCGEAIVAKILFVFMAGRVSSVDYSTAGAPETPGADGAADAAPPRGHKFFTDNFDIRHALPIKTKKTPEFMRWVRLRERDGLDPMTEYLCVGDCLPPAAMGLFAKPAPVSSINWTVNMLTDQPRSEDGWWLLHALADHARQGCSSQMMKGWGAAGEPVSAGCQSVAVFV